MNDTIEVGPRPLVKKNMISLKDWHPGNLDLTNPFSIFDGKRIRKTSWMPGGVDIWFTDGTRGYIEMMIHQDQFNADVADMIKHGEMYLTAGLCQ